MVCVMNTSIEVITSNSSILGAKGFLILNEYAHNGNAVQSLSQSATQLRALADELLQAATELEAM